MDYKLIFSSLIAGIMCFLTAILALPADVVIDQRILITISAGSLLQVCKDIHSYLTNPTKK